MQVVSPYRVKSLESNILYRKPKNVKELFVYKKLFNQLGIKASMDVGSSDKICGTAKEKLYDRDYSVLLHDSGKLCPDGIKNSQDLVEHLAEKFENCMAFAKKAGKKINELIIFTTGRPRLQEDGSYKIARFTTLFAKNGEELNNVDYSQFKYRFHGVKVSIFNDMLGAMSAVLQKIKPSEIPDSGLVITTGGGFGTGYFKKINSNGHSLLKLSESRDGRRPIHGTTMEEYGNSIRAYIRNFCSELGMDEQKIMHYINKGDGSFVTWKNPEFFKENPISQEVMSRASKKSIDRYAEGIAHCVKLKIVDDGGSLNQVFLSGRLVDGINNFIENHSEIWGKQELNLEKLIKSNLENDVGAENLAKVKDFKVSITSGISDNTEGATFLLGKKYKVRNEQERGQDIVSIYVPIAK